jgi:ESF2/ABP1 family protein
MMLHSRGKAGAAYQKAVREKKLAQELSNAKRERDFYLSQVAKAKKNEAIVSRKRLVFS